MKNWLERYIHQFYLDTRALALYRISLGMIGIAATLQRWPLAEELYSDTGVITRSLLLQNTDYFTRHFLLFLSGNVFVTYFFFILTILVSICVSLGIKSKWSTLCLWLLTCSIHARSPIAITGGDTIYQVLLFWAVFLPLDHNWSWQTRFKMGTPTSVYGLASFGFILQLVSVYFFSAMIKLQSDQWLIAGNALSSTFQLDYFAKPLGRMLLEYPNLLDFLSRTTIILELAPLLLILFPQRNWLRFSIAIMLIFFHFSLSLTMALALFPWICIGAWLALIPTNNLNRMPSAQSKFQRIFASAAILLIIYLNLFSVIFSANDKPPRPIREVVHTFGLNQRWSLFSGPPGHNIWFRIKVLLKDGRSLNPLTGKPTYEEENNHLRYELVPNHAYRKFLSNARTSKYYWVLPHLAPYHCKKWNEQKSSSDKAHSFYFETVFAMKGSHVVTNYFTLSEALCEASP